MDDKEQGLTRRSLAAMIAAVFIGGYIATTLGLYYDSPRARAKIDAYITWAEYGFSAHAAPRYR